MRRLFVVGCLSALGIFPQDAPEFRTGIRLVQVDVIVRDKSGFVPGLAKDKFELFDEGKQQSISSFASPTALNSADRVLNRQAGATAILVDHMNTEVTMQPYVHNQLIQFAHHRAGTEPIAVYVLTDTGLREIHDFTDSPEHLAQAVGDLRPERWVRPTSAATVYQTAHDLMVMTTGAMNEIAQHMSNVRGRKNLVWISSAFPVFVNNLAQQFDFTQDIARNLQAVSDANVAVYPVDARGLVSSSVQRRLCGPYFDNCGVSEAPNLNTLNLIADLTGGKAYYNTNGIADSVTQASHDGDQVYTLGFYPSEGAMDETFHKLRVHVDAPGVEVRARPGYFASKPTPAEAPPIQ